MMRGQRQRRLGRQGARSGAAGALGGEPSLTGGGGRWCGAGLALEEESCTRFSAEQGQVRCCEWPSRALPLTKIPIT